jgi:hypothetical protein
MKAILSGLVSDCNGKLGDIVACHNHYGLFFRTRIDTPPNYSPYWIAIRDKTISLSQEWRTLAQSVRDAWNEGAKLFRRSDYLGQPYYQTGLNFYVGNNLNRWFCGESTSYVPPAPIAVPLFQSLSLAADSGTPDKLLIFSPAISSSYKIKLFVSQPLNAGRNKAFHYYRLLKMLDDSFASGDSIESDFVTRFGVSGSAGEKIFVKSIFVHKASGLVGQPIYCSSIIV